MRDIRVDFINNEIIMTRKFAAKASDPRSAEYTLLQATRQAYPNFAVRKHTIKKNASKECYKGLTYDYMRNYILTHESKVAMDKVLAEFDNMLLISQCHSKGYRYPTIKKWFLDKYPEISQFGMTAKVEEEMNNVCEFAMGA